MEYPSSGPNEFWDNVFEGFYQKLDTVVKDDIEQLKEYVSTGTDYYKIKKSLRRQLPSVNKKKYVAHVYTNDDRKLAKRRIWETTDTSIVISQGPKAEMETIRRLQSGRQSRKRLMQGMGSKSVNSLKRLVPEGGAISRCDL